MTLRISTMSRPQRLRCGDVQCHALDYTELDQKLIGTIYDRPSGGFGGFAGFANAANADSNLFVRYVELHWPKPGRSICTTCHMRALVGIINAINGSPRKSTLISCQCVVAIINNCTR